MTLVPDSVGVVLPSQIEPGQKTSLTTPFGLGPETANTFTPFIPSVEQIDVPDQTLVKKTAGLNFEL